MTTRAARALLLLGALSSLHQTARAQTTTIISHGYTTGEKGAWVQSLASAIIARAGGLGSVYRYQDSTPGISLVPAAGGDGSSSNIVLIFNWVPESAGVSTGPNLSFVQAAGDALYALLRDPLYAPATSGPADLLTGRFVHFIGHSRGACVNSEAILRLALAGIPVDQMTTHDPHPVNGTLDARYNFDWADPTPVRWSNVTFADNYWRADGGGIFNGLDFDGISLPNAFNTQLSESTLDSGGYSFAHSDVHLWYHGTVDLAQNPSDGEQTITNAMRNSWWNPGGYTQRGFYYSQIGGGAAFRPALPPGTVPSPSAAPTLYNGSFDSGSYAGWSYHGGSANLVNASGWVARLNSTSPSLIHNRSFIPAPHSTISLLLRRTGSGTTDDILRLRLQRAEDPLPIDLSSAAWSVASLPSSFQQFSVFIPAQFRDRTCRLWLTLDGNSSAINSTIDADDLAILPAPFPGDLDFDDDIDIDDLTLVILHWGTSNPLGDADADGDVDIDDLTLVILNWGQSP